MKFIKYWLPVIIYAIFIFYLSAIPGQNIPVAFDFQDVILHFIEYFLFGLLFARAVKVYQPYSSFRRRFFVVFFFCFFYALSDETHQLFVPQRYFSLFDLMYDGLGICVAGIFYQYKRGV